jgi:hypothetical protein
VAIPKEIMTIHIIASGETGAKWDGIGPSIGVNDAAKWGYGLDYLLLLNSPGQFQQSRLETILKTKVKKVYTNLEPVWKKHFDNTHKIHLRKWSVGEKISPNYIYHSHTSPFVGISLAYSWGFNKIVLWGVDLMTHRHFGIGQNKHFPEVNKFRTFALALKEKGVRVFIGSRGTAMDEFLPVWDKESINA